MNNGFEIITKDGLRYRCNKPNHRWQYGLQTGGIDIIDKSVVEVLRQDGDEERLAFTITDVSVVGDVTGETLLLMPREKRVTLCPRCGYTEVED